MSMNSKNLSVLAYANGFTLWHYKTEDTKETVIASGYFNDVSNIFNVGDLIVASSSINSTITTSILLVSAVNSGVVSVSKIV